MSRRVLVAALLGAAALGAVPASAQDPLSMCYKVYEPVNGGVYTICPEDYLPI